MVRAVEVEVVDAGRRTIQVDVAPGRIRFRAGRLVPERDEEPRHFLHRQLDQRRQRARLAVQHELERAHALHRAHLARRGRDLEDRLLVGNGELGRHAVREVRLVVADGQHPRPPVEWDRRVRACGEELVLQRAILQQALDVAGLVRRRRAARARRQHGGRQRRASTARSSGRQSTCQLHLARQSSPAAPLAAQPTLQESAPFHGADS